MHGWLKVFLGLKVGLMLMFWTFELSIVVFILSFLGLATVLETVLAFYSNHLDTLSKDYIILPCYGCKLFTELAPKCNILKLSLRNTQDSSNKEN